MHKGFNRAFAGLPREYRDVSLSLFRIMVPALIIIRLLEGIGFISWLGTVLAPLMAWVGLPGELALVWVTTMATNIYTGLLIFFTQPDLNLTVAQVTTLGGMMLIAHNLIVEGGIARSAGVRLRFTLLWRVGGSLLYGILLFHLYGMLDWLQTPWTPAWQPEAADPSLKAWAWSQLQGLAIIAGVIALLLVVLRLLRWIGVEALLQRMLAPCLNLLGIGRQAASLILVGLTLGLAFGGGLLIREARQGHIPPRDVTAAICFLGLGHSVIEDTLLILAMGADISGVLVFRLVLTLVFSMLLARVLKAMPDTRLGLITRPLR
ncbi:nucleoside recognition domain-containing protein [Hahella sp. SMD15-11]|uniref:Nucleoside recognition domain-containing protein n=1 Tax=Thermohahella caldifontis TaxID=3142973 RepID=A0AB39UT56_9GAMM